jgi:glucose/arabinose dehydrogenase
MVEPESREHAVQAIAPKEFPKVPEPDAAAAWVPDGYEVDIVIKDLTYPSSVELDDRGNLYVAEAGYAYGDLVAPARILRFSPAGKMEVIAKQLSGPITDLLWHDGKLFISQRGKISSYSDGHVEDLVTGLPSFGDHHNNQMTVGPDGKIYFGQGAATNAGVVGLDNVYPFLWLAFYPDVHDIPARDMELNDVTFTTPDPLTVLARQGEMVGLTEAVKRILSKKAPLLIETGAFQPFGRSAERVKGQLKANATVMRVDPDGSNLEQYAWGLRNPFGLQWSPDGKLYAADNGYDERGSRPVANAPDAIWLVREDAFYGYPDYVAGVPITDPRFKSSRGEAPKFIMKKHPRVERPVLTRPPHSAVTKIEFARSAAFGFAGQMFLGEFGSGVPATAPTGGPAHGYQLVRIDLTTKRVEPFFKARQEALGPSGHEYFATSAPKHPMDARFSDKGDALYVVDFGAMAFFAAGAGPAARPIPQTGVVWRITKKGQAPRAAFRDISAVGAAPAAL